jgi:maltokinase
MTVATVSTVLPGIERALVNWLPAQRWFGAAARPVEHVRLSVLAEFAGDADGRRGVLATATVSFADSTVPRRYQLPLGFGATLPEHAEPVATVDGLVVFDAVTDPGMAAELLWLIGRNQVRGAIRFTPEPRGELAFAHRNGLRARRIEGEQSNTSVVFGDRFILKLFRQLADGVNPDLGVHRALGRAGSRHVAPLLGAIEGDVDGTRVTFGMLNSFASDASDGWRLASAEVRDMLWGQPPDGRFSGLAASLGAAVAAVHDDLASQWGTTSMSAIELRDMLLSRLADAVDIVPALRPYRDFVADGFNEVGRLRAVPAQRVHGDLHLGQVLRTPARWLLIDFEGEPALPVAERVRPRSPLRDVAGMLRSFEYAAFQPLQVQDVTGMRDSGARLAEQWVSRVRDAFCMGYADTAGVDPRDHDVLLLAHELEQVVREVVHETRNRPSWVRIPLRSLRMMAES